MGEEMGLEFWFVSENKDDLWSNFGTDKNLYKIFVKIKKKKNTHM